MFTITENVSPFSALTIERGRGSFRTLDSCTYRRKIHFHHTLASGCIPLLCCYCFALNFNCHQEQGYTCSCLEIGSKNFLKSCWRLKTKCCLFPAQHNDHTPLSTQPRYLPAWKSGFSEVVFMSSSFP